MRLRALHLYVVRNISHVLYVSNYPYIVRINRNSFFVLSKDFISFLSRHHRHFFERLIPVDMAAAGPDLPLPVLAEGWSAEKDFKPIGSLSPPTQRNIEPVGPHFLAYARRVCISQRCKNLFF